MKKFDFRDLFVLDLANNHQGSAVHGIAIISRCAEVVARHGVRAAIKFQFRDLDTFVHKDADRSNKHVARFLQTRLSWEDYLALLYVVKQRGLVSMCTPFDEASVDKIVEMGFDVIKIASCSANDWPLVEKAASTGLPMIVSTGGLSLDQIDDVVSMLEHRGVDFALMHCVSIYPTPGEMFNLKNIATLRARYPGRVIGWSTHEYPTDVTPVGLALALGAEMFEKHVGLSSLSIVVNSYSASPEQVSDWIYAWKNARMLLGSADRQVLPAELREIDRLRRGIFASRPISAGMELTSEDVYFAFPYEYGGLSNAEWKSGIIATDYLPMDAPVLKSSVRVPEDSDAKILKDATHEVKSLLNQAGVTLTSDFTVEYSHHYGVKNFREVGAVLINVVNRLYCKKVLVQLPGQHHPRHFHKLKEETFLVLHGTLHVEVENRVRVLNPGDTVLILPGVWHRFWSNTGCVFEEISTTHFGHDSVYADQNINENPYRKTTVDHWGRFQL